MFRYWFPLAWPKEVLGKEMSATIRYETGIMLNMQNIPQIGTDYIIQPSPLVVLENIKEPL